MLFEQLMSLFHGYLCIRFYGERVERFINLCLQRGIPVWDVYTTREGTVVAKTTIDGFRQMRPVARRSRVSVRIIKRRGLPFLVAKLWRRTGFVAGALLFIISLHLLGSVIWFIDVKGVEEIQPKVVLSAASQLGLRPGVFRHNLNSVELGKALCIEMPELAWAGIDLVGTRATIRVVEKKIVTPEPKPVGHIIAARSGVLQKIVPTAGRAMAKPGDTVQEGQLLISGVFQVDEESEIRYVHAEGIVTARLWYEAEAESAMRRVTEQRTGQSVTVEYLIVGDTIIWLIGPRDAPYELYEEHCQSLPLVWRNLGAPVEHIRKTFFELVAEYEEVSFEQARQEAADIAMAAAIRQLPADVSLENQIVQTEVMPDQNTVRVRIVLETIEPIGRFTPLTEHP